MVWLRLIICLTHSDKKKFYNRYLWIFILIIIVIFPVAQEIGSLLNTDNNVNCRVFTIFHWFRCSSQVLKDNSVKKYGKWSQNHLNYSCFIIHGGCLVNCVGTTICNIGQPVHLFDMVEVSMESMQSVEASCRHPKGSDQNVEYVAISGCTCPKADSHNKSYIAPDWSGTCIKYEQFTQGHQEICG